MFGDLVKRSDSKKNFYLLKEYNIAEIKLKNTNLKSELRALKVKSNFITKSWVRNKTLSITQRNKPFMIDKRGHMKTSQNNP